MAKQIFRQESLDRLTSPEELDRLFTVVGVRAWIPLAALGLLLGTALVWSIFGRIPETATGAGVLINPGKVRGLQSPYGGQIVELRVRSGQIIKPGDVLAIVNQPELRQQLQQARNRLKELQRTDDIQTRLETTRVGQEKTLRGAQIKLIQEAVGNIEELTAKMALKNEALTREQKEKLVHNQKETRALYLALKEKLQNLRRLGENKLVTVDTVLGAESNVVDTNLQLTNLDLKISELEVKEIDNKQYLIQQANRIDDLKIQLRELELKATNGELEIMQMRTARAGGLMEQQDRIKQLESYLEEQGIVKSLYAGRVLEVSAQPGQVTQAGARIGAMEIDDNASPGADATAGLKVLAYFPLKTGKRIQEGMPVRVTPATVERERHGSIMGKVARVSAFPITPEAVTAIVGSPEIVQALVQPGGMIEVEVELEHDAHTYSGFHWTSGGPHLKFSAGITSSVRVTLEERAPITFLFPILKSSVGGGE